MWRDCWDYRALIVQAGLFAGLMCGVGCANWAIFSDRSQAGEPAALNPFSGPGGSALGEREDALPGFIELSDGSIHFGRVYMTRDKRFKIYDSKLQRQREIPLGKIKQIECKVDKEWEEREWRFKELAKDEKLYTGRSYPAREYSCVVTLQDERTIAGTIMNSLLYVQPGEMGAPKPGQLRPQKEPERYLLHHRDKGEMGQTLKQLLYVKLVKLGDEAFEEGKRRAKSHPPAVTHADKPESTTGGAVK